MAKHITPIEWAELRARRWSEDDARRVLSIWRDSQQTLSAFAQSHGLVAQRLSWWSRRLGDWQAPAPLPATVRLLPAVLRAPSEAARLRVLLPHGVVLEADAGALSPEWLAALVHGLEHHS